MQNVIHMFEPRPLVYTHRLTFGCKLRKLFDFYSDWFETRL
jgi:hypothetical protein